MAMTNYEKYEVTLMDIMRDGHSFAVDKTTDMPVPCSSDGIPCAKCKFNESGVFDCPELRKKWLEATTYDGEIPADVITNVVVSEELKNAIRAFYNARRISCVATDCSDCVLKNENWCYEVAQFETLFYIFGPELTKDMKDSLLKWYELIKETHPEYLK